MKYFFMQNKLRTTLVLLIILFQNAAVTGSYLYLGFIINSLNKNPLIVINVITNILIFLLMLILKNVFTFLHKRERSILINKMGIDLKNKTIDKIISQPIKKYFDTPIGTYLSWWNYDVNVIMESGFLSVFLIFSRVSSLLFSIFTISVLRWELALFLILLNLLTFLVPILLSRIIQKINFTHSQLYEKTYGKISKLLNSFNILYFSQKLNIFKNLFSIAIDESIYLFFQNNKKLFFINSIIIGLITSTSLAILYLLSGLYVRGNLIIIGNEVITIGMFTTIILIGINLWSSFSDIYWFSIGINSIKPILKKNIFITSNEMKGLSKLDLKNFKKFISMDIYNLNYSYDDKQIIKNFNLKIHQGKKYAILGESGSGKSTLLKILLGVLKDYQGSIKLNNFELKNIQYQNLQNLMSFVDNKNFLFNDSIKNNINLWDEQTKNINVFKEKANINDIKDDFIINEFENTLSDGQKQRINLARAFYEEKKVLILDEATANLDKENAILIEKSLLSDPSLTLIMVTHHLKNELVNLYDEIIYL